MLAIRRGGVGRSLWRSQLILAYILICRAFGAIFFDSKVNENAGVTHS
jgi:hypothetical protein